MIDVKFYHTNSPNNKLGKTLSDENIISCAFKGNCDILNPIIVVKSDSFFDYNYCYIEQFKRYYFINDVEILPNNVYTLTLKVDVLDSYKDSILKNYVHVTRKENSNLLGANISTLESTTIKNYKFNSIFKLRKTFTLVTSIGGYKE